MASSGIVGCAAQRCLQWAKRGLDNVSSRNYLGYVNLIRRTLEIDPGTDARLDAIAAERGQDVSTVLAEALALLDSVVDITEADLGEDRRRLGEFMRTREAIPLDEVKTWVASWDSAGELARPTSRKIG